MIKYKTSKLTRIFTFGINRYGFKIDRGFLYKLGSFSKKINIEFIDYISFDQVYVQNAMTYVYTLTNKKGKTYQLGYSLLDGITYQKMFLELLSINSNIKLDDKMKAFMESEITDKVLEFDFKVYEENYWKRDQELAQKHPALDAFIGLTIVFFFSQFLLFLGFLVTHICLKCMANITKCFDL